MNALTPRAVEYADALRLIAAEGPPPSKFNRPFAAKLGRDHATLGRALDGLQGEGLLAGDYGLTDQGRAAVAALDRAAGSAAPAEVQAAPHRMFRPDPDNPRRDFESPAAVAALWELAADIDARGLDHNLVVRPAEADGVMMIRSGESRWRAIGLAILFGQAWDPDRLIPYTVKDEDEVGRLFGALAENIQRRALNPIEEGQAFKRARDELGIETDEIARRISKTRRFVQLRIQLLNAPPMVQLDLIAGKITLERALEYVQQPKPKAEPPPWTPDAKAALLLVEIAHKCGDAPAAEIPHWPPPGGPMQQLISHAGCGLATGPGENGRVETVHIGWRGRELLDRLGLNPATDPSALFRARQAAGLGLPAIKDLEASGRYHTPWLNADYVPPEARAPEVDYAALHAKQVADRAEREAARPPQDFAAQVREAIAEDEEDEAPTQEMFAGQDLGQPCPDEDDGDSEPAAPPRDARAHALRLMHDLAPEVADYMDIVEAEDAFDWAKADMPTLADRLVFYLENETILGVAGTAAAMWARGGEMFSARALAGAWRRAVHRAFGIARGEAPRMFWRWTPTGEIVDVDDGSVMAELDEGVSEEDGRAIAAAPQLRKALLGLLAVRPVNHDDEDDPDAAAAAWDYAQALIAATEPEA